MTGKRTKMVEADYWIGLGLGIVLGGCIVIFVQLSYIIIRDAIKEHITNSIQEILQKGDQDETKD